MIRRRYASSATFGASRAISDVRVASNERISIVSFGRTVERLAVQRRAFAAPRDPLLAAAEVVDVAEVHVAHPLAVGDRDRDREERDAALRVQRAVDRVDHDDGRRPLPSRPTSSETIVTSSMLAQARDDRVLGRLVDRRRLVAAEPLTDDRLALGARRQLLEHAAHVARPHARQSSSQSVTAGRAAGRSSASGRRTCSSAASRRHGRAISHTSSMRVGRSRNAASASPRSTAATASLADGVYVTPCGASRRRPQGRARRPASSSYRPSR